MSEEKAYQVKGMKLHLFFPTVICPGAKLHTSFGSVLLKRALDAFCESEALTSSRLPLPQQRSKNLLVFTQHD